jgi:hypothetical protein
MFGSIPTRRTWIQNENGKEREMHTRVYIYENEAIAEKIARTAYYQYDAQVEQMGSAVKMEIAVYEQLIKDTYTPEAEWIAILE